MTVIDAPIGFLMALVENEKAMRHFSTMTEGARNQVVERARHVSSKAEMQSIVHELE